MSENIRVFRRGSTVAEIQADYARAGIEITPEDVRRAAVRAKIAIDPRTDRIEGALPAALLAPTQAATSTVQLESPKAAIPVKTLSMRQRAAESARRALTDYTKNLNLSTPLGRVKMEVLAAPTRAAQQRFVASNPSFQYVTVKYNIDADTARGLGIGDARVQVGGKLALEVQFPVDLEDKNLVENLKARVEALVQRGIPFSVDDARDDERWQVGSVVHLDGSVRIGASGTGQATGTGFATEKRLYATLEKSAPAQLALSYDLEDKDTASVGGRMGVAGGNVHASIGNTDETMSGRDYVVDLLSAEQSAALQAALPWSGDARRWLSGVDLTGLDRLGVGSYDFGLSNRENRGGGLAIPFTGGSVGASASDSEESRGFVTIPGREGDRIFSADEARGIADRLLARDPEALKTAPANTKVELVLTGNEAWSVTASATHGLGSILSGAIKAELGVRVSAGETTGDVARVVVNYVKDQGKTKAVVDVYRYHAAELIRQLNIGVGLTVTTELKDDLRRWTNGGDEQAGVTSALADHASGGSRLKEKLGDAAYKALAPQLNKVLKKVALSLEVRDNERRFSELAFSSPPIDLSDASQQVAFMDLVGKYDVDAAVRMGLFREVKEVDGATSGRHHDFSAVLTHLSIDDSAWQTGESLRVKLPATNEEFHINGADVGGNRDKEGTFEDVGFKARLVTVRDAKTDEAYDTRMMVRAKIKDWMVFQDEKVGIDVMVDELGLTPTDHYEGKPQPLIKFLPFTPKVYGKGEGEFGLSINRNGARKLIAEGPQVFELHYQRIVSRLFGVPTIPTSLQPGASALGTTFHPRALELAAEYSRTKSELAGARERAAELGAPDEAAFAARFASIEGRFGQEFPSGDLANTAEFVSRAWSWQKAGWPGKSKKEIEKSVAEFVSQRLGREISRDDVRGEFKRARAADILADYAQVASSHGSDEQAKRSELASDYERMTGRRLDTDFAIMSCTMIARSIFDVPEVREAQAILAKDPKANIPGDLSDRLVKAVWTRAVEVGRPGATALSGGQDAFAAAMWLAVARTAGRENTQGYVAFKAKRFFVTAGSKQITDIDMDRVMRDVVIDQNAAAKKKVAKKN